MYGNLDKLNLLENSFIKNELEVVHIRDLHHISSIYHFKHSSYLYTEVYLAVDATSFFLKKGKVKTKNLSSLYLTIDTSTIINPNEENIGTLLIHEDPCVREASKFWIEYAV